MIINNNISALNALKTHRQNLWETDKSMAKIASGERITRSADDATGLAVSEKMRTQVRGLRQAERNTEDGLSFVQTADGYLDQTSNLLQRIRVLAVQSANGIYSSADRMLMQVEISQLVDEVNRVSSQAEFNNFKLFQGDYARSSKKASMWFHMGPNMHQRERAYIQTMTATALGVGNVTLTSVGKSNEAIGLVDAALENLMKQRADLGAYSNRMESAAKSLMSAYENVSAAESRIRDTDIAEEMIKLTRSQILEHASSSMIAQANMRPRSALRLLEI